MRKAEIFEIVALEKELGQVVSRLILLFGNQLAITRPHLQTARQERVLETRILFDKDFYHTLFYGFAPINACIMPFSFPADDFSAFSFELLGKVRDGLEGCRGVVGFIATIFSGKNVLGL